MGPIKTRAKKPKLSLMELLPPKTDVRPTPRAIIKGTVNGPVVTPPASKDIGKKLGGTKAAKINTNR